MKRVHIIYDIYDSEKKTVAEVDSVLDYLKFEFKEFPKNAKVFHSAWHDDNDITEELQKNENYADSLDCDIIIVIYPAWIQIIYYAIVAIIAAFSLYTVLTMPKPQVSAPQSANNDLASRQNQPRLGGRVPDIYGELRAVPDLISAPFTFYDANDKEIEECLMVLGRGYYQIHDVREDTTNVLDIPNSAVSVYDPDTNIKGAPIFQIGESFTLPPLLTTKSKAINGQTLDVPNDQKIESSLATFKYPNIIKANDVGVNFISMFSEGQTIGVYGAEYLIQDISISGFSTLTLTKHVIIESSINIDNVEDFKAIVLSNALVEVVTEILPVPPETTPTYVSKYYDLSGRYSISSVTKTTVGSNFRYDIALNNAEFVNGNWNYLDVDKNSSVNINFTDNENSINLNGTYLISGVSASEILLSSPNLTNNDWGKLPSIPNQETLPVPSEIRLDVISSKWVGWFNIEQDNTDELVFNVFFQNGLFYQDSKGGVWWDTMTVCIEYQYLDNENTPFGSISTIYQSISNNSKSPFGRTIRFALATSGRVRFRISRTTPTKNDKTQDLCKIKDVYAASRSNLLHYKDVTIVRTKTLGTEGALALKERKLNMLVTRKLAVNGTGPLTPTKSGAQALINIALDQKNGRRTLAEIDVAQILAEEQAVIDYFGGSKAAEFSYTFDDNNLSFEEMAGMIASTIFCEAYRYGSKLRLRFEGPQDNSVLLFNHTNKAPNSEKRTKSFGIDNNYDGVEVEYTSPNDDTRITYVATDSSNPINTLKIKTSGIRSDEQAKTRAWREWNKLKYRNMSVEFEAWEESELLARMDRILVADNTTIETIDGEVEAVDGLRLYLSQPIPQAGNYNIYLQLPNATVDIVPCTYLDEYSVQLTRMPLVNLAIGRATYQLILSSSPAPKPFLMTELRPQSKMTNILTCINYDSRYYANDLDFF